MNPSDAFLIGYSLGFDAGRVLARMDTVVVLPYEGPEPEEIDPTQPEGPTQRTGPEDRRTYNTNAYDSNGYIIGRRNWRSAGRRHGDVPYGKHPTKEDRREGPVNRRKFRQSGPIRRVTGTPKGRRKSDESELAYGHMPWNKRVGKVEDRRVTIPSGNYPRRRFTPGDVGRREGDKPYPGSRRGK